MPPPARWALWASLTLLGFTWLETYALRRHEPGGTLSEVTQAVVGVHPRSRRRWVLIPVFVGFLSWVLVHILSEPVHMDQLEDRP